MDAGVWLVAGLLALTKFCDVVSTSRRIRGLGEETNPFARGLMRRVGVQRAIWIVFALALAIIGAATWWVLGSRDAWWLKAGYILAGLAISGVQWAVAHCNWTGRENAVTRRLRTVHRASAGRCRD